MRVNRVYLLLGLNVYLYNVIVIIIQKIIITSSFGSEFTNIQVYDWSCVVPNLFLASYLE